jgi:hypothetical protein
MDMSARFDVAGRELDASDEERNFGSSSRSMKLC